MQTLWQRLNYAPDGLGMGGGDDEGGDDQQQQTQHQTGEGGEEEKPSKFAQAGLGKFRKAEGEEGEGGDQDQQQGDKGGDRPEWLPEKFKSPEALARAYADLETKLRNGGKINPDDIVPDEATPEAYFGEEIELDPEVDRLALTSDDPGLKVAAEVFKKYGIGKQTAQAIVKDMFKGMNEHAPAPVDPEQELKALGPNGPAVVDGTILWLEKLDREGKLSDEDANFAINLMSTAQGVRFLNKMRGMSGERSIPVGTHVPSSGGMSPEEWHVEMQRAVAAKDYKRQEELDRIGKGVFGSGVSAGSPIRGLPE